MNLESRVSKLERATGANDIVHIIFANDGETMEQAWTRTNPGNSLPPENERLLVCMWIGSDEQGSDNV